MRVYIAGPMTGRPDNNYPAFHAAALHLRELGYDVISPAEMHPDAATNPQPYAAYIRADLMALLGAQAVVLLPGWKHSRGARLEEAVATACGLEVMALEGAPYETEALRPPNGGADAGPARTGRQE